MTVGEDAEVIAHGALVPRGGRASHVGEVIFFVHDDHVGRGYGAAMLDALLDLADNWLGLRRVELDVNVDNAAVIRLHQGRGFALEGAKRGDVLPDGMLITSHVMAS